MITHLLFDFFGTLVSYSASRTEQGYERSHRLVAEAGATLGYARFLSLWDKVADGFEAESRRSHREFSMEEAGTAFLERALGRAPTRELVERFVAAYLSEWSGGVRYPAGLRELLERLSARHTLAIVTNTHDPTLVPMHLERMGVADLFADVVTSVEHGLRKPHPHIFRHALRRLGARPERSVYVGDDFHADYEGATAAGMRAFLIDPERRSPVPYRARLRDAFDLEARLSDGE